MLTFENDESLRRGKNEGVRWGGSCRPKRVKTYRKRSKTSGHEKKGIKKTAKKR